MTGMSILGCSPVVRDSIGQLKGFNYSTSRFGFDRNPCRFVPFIRKRMYLSNRDR